MTKADSANLGYAYHLPSGGFLMKIRNALSQFSDLFSEFNRYISPAYHHDRCERSVQMRLYSMHKREFVMIFFGFFAFLGLGICIGLAGPPISVTSKSKATELLRRQNSTDIANGPFQMQSPLLSPYCQQLWVIAVVQTDNSDDETYDKSFHVSVDIDGINSENKKVKVLKFDKSHNRTRHLKCERQLCDQVTVAHLGFINFDRYVFTVYFYELGSFHQRYRIKEMTFYFKSYNPGFTQLEMWFRFIFLLTTFSIYMWYNYSLRKFPVHDWSIEQKWMSFLLPLLLLYNDPIFAIRFLMNSWLPGMLDATFQATFLSALLMFWLCVYHGLRQNERKLLTFYMPKLFFILPLWTCAIVLATWERINELQDPTYNYQWDTYNYNTFKTIFFIFVGLYLAYLFCLILRAYTELRSMPFFDMRLKFMTLLVLIVLSISITITIMRFGVGVLEDNFVAELSTQYQSSAQFMGFYGLLNFYTYTMAYVYSPSKKTVYETSITKDNPAFSMINDSDEDVIYSDDESRQPLNRSYNEDDSD